MKFIMEDQNKINLLQNQNDTFINYNDFCRFCLTKTKNNISIEQKCFPGESADMNVESIYNFVTKFGFIKMKSSSNFPSKVCEKCYNLIKSCYRFSQICQKTDDFLRNIKETATETAQKRLSELNCSLCSLKFKSSKALDFHHAATHANKRFRSLYKFQCRNCTELFGDQERLKKHYELTHGVSQIPVELLNTKTRRLVRFEKKQFFCFHCTPYKELQNQDEFVQHLNSHNSTNQEENKSSKMFDSIDSTISNPNATTVLVEENGLTGNDSITSNPWKCLECSAAYSQKQSLQHHMREKHPETNLGRTKCPEPNCPEFFLSNRQLIQHGIRIHQKYFAYQHEVFKKILRPAQKDDDSVKNFECDVCQKKYTYKSSLRKHIQAIHLENATKDAVVCFYCGKTFVNKLNLKSHIEFVHEALFVCCPICKKKINFRTIGKHYKTHQSDQVASPKNSFLCNLCGKILKSKGSFADHQKLHKNIRDELCDVCGSGFTTKKFLRLHKKTHEGGVRRKVFTCDQCEKAFSGRHTLNRHLLMHSGKKNFICEICSKCFYTLQELNRHVRCHKKEYRFDCQLCEMRFLDKSRFRLHMMRHRNVRPHKCEFCEKMFIVRGKLNLHLATKHNVEVQSTKGIWKDPKTYVPLDELL